VDKTKVTEQDDTYGVAPRNWLTGPIDRAHEQIGIVDCGAASFRLIGKLLDDPSTVDLWNDLKIPGQCKGIEWMADGKDVIVTGMIVKKVDGSRFVDKKQRENRVDIQCRRHCWQLHNQ